MGKIFIKYKKIRFIFDSADFNYLISRPFLSLLDDYYVRLKEFYSNNSFEAAIVLQYNGFFEKCLLRIFQELKRPTFFWHHGGVTSFYDSRLDKRADYFIMWGDIQVKAYKEMGYDPSKFLISGHPVYNEKPQSFKFDYGIAIKEHCFACSAGAGSSCGGTLT